MKKYEKDCCRDVQRLRLSSGVIVLTPAYCSISLCFYNVGASCGSVCSCGSSCIVETKRNPAVHRSEHNDSRGKSEPAKHLYNNPSHIFSLRIILSASKNARVRKNLEASVVALKMRDLNNQTDFKKLPLFRYGVTQIFQFFHSYCLFMRMFVFFKLLSVSFYSTEDDYYIEKLLLTLLLRIFIEKEFCKKGLMKEFYKRFS